MKLILVTTALAIMFFPSRAQKSQYSFEILYDAPNSVEKFFFKVQPLYTELFVTNLNIGFGAEINYYMDNRWDFRMNYRRAYTTIFDISKNIARKFNNADNAIKSFNYVEVGGNFHLRDGVSNVRGKSMLYDNDSTADMRLYAPNFITLNTKRREIVGARFGAFFYQSSTDLGRALKDQQASLINSNNGVLDINNLTLIGNMSTQGVYLGGSLTLIRNYALKFEYNYRPAVEDLILNLFADVLYAPNINIEPVGYSNEVYFTDEVKTSNFGFRVGVEGMFNRSFGWSYKGEIGYRPSIQARTFYLLVTIGFPVFGASFEADSEQ